MSVTRGASWVCCVPVGPAPLVSQMGTVKEGLRCLAFRLLPAGLGGWRWAAGRTERRCPGSHYCPDAAAAARLPARRGGRASTRGRPRIHSRPAAHPLKAGRTSTRAVVRRLLPSAHHRGGWRDSGPSWGGAGAGERRTRRGSAAGWLPPSQRGTRGAPPPRGRRVPATRLQCGSCCTPPVPVAPAAAATQWRRRSLWRLFPCP